MPTFFARIGATALMALLLGTATMAAERNPIRSRGAPVESPTAARVIVKYRADGVIGREQAAAVTQAAKQPLHAATMGQRLGLALTDGRVLGERSQVLRAQGLTSTALAARLSADSEVEYAVPDQRRQALMVPDDPLEGPQAPTASPAVGQWYLRAPVAPALAAINAEAAWDATTGSSAITVAVVDTGVRPDHPDLAGKLLSGYDFVSNVDAANDGDGRDNDPSDPGDWVTATEANTVGGPYYHCGLTDDNGNYVGEASSWHGTQVSGLIGARTNNSIGIASVGNQVMVLPVRVLGVCGGYDSDIIAGLRWAGGISTDTTLPTNVNKANVINLSLGSQGTCTQPYIDVFAALAAANVTVVAAAGNDTGLAVGVPANCPNVIAVGGVRHTGTKVGYSDLGPEVALSAPAGNCVNVLANEQCLYPLVTTRNDGTTGPTTNGYSDGFNHPSLGTSFSSPLVAGAAALMLSVKPSMTPAQIRAALTGSTRSFPTTGSDATVAACQAPTSTIQDECYCTIATCGSGLLDVSAAVQAALSNALPSATATAAAATVTVGATVALDGSASVAATGRSLAAYQWNIIGGTGQASFSGATNGPTATLLTTAAGTVSVSLTVTDNVGLHAASTTTVGVNPLPVTSGGGGSTTGGSTGGTTGGGTTTPAPASSGGGGGGALDYGWLLGLALAVIVLRRQRPGARHRA